jgi:hypothetical protein
MNFPSIFLIKISKIYMSCYSTQKRGWSLFEYFLRPIKNEMSQWLLKNVLLFYSMGGFLLSWFWQNDGFFFIKINYFWKWIKDVAENGFSKKYFMNECYIKKILENQLKLHHWSFFIKKNYRILLITLQNSIGVLFSIGEIGILWL